MTDDFSELVDAWLNDELSDHQAAELNERLRNSESCRQAFVAQTEFNGLIHGAVAEAAVARAAGVRSALNPENPGGQRFAGAGFLMVLSAVAAGILVAATMQWTTRSVSPVAQLVSSENAAWESLLPTTTGSKLEPGLLKLKAGIATIQFDSGAEIVLESPAELELIDSMRGRLLSGAAVIDVPQKAVGFIVETPDGFAIDYGTRFAVTVDREGRQSSFELIDGEIAVHHPPSGGEVRLTGKSGTAKASSEALVVIDSEQEMDEAASSSELAENLLRLGTKGRTGSVIRNNKRKRLSVDAISAKKTEKRNWDQRSFFSFDVPQADGKTMRSVRLRLNLVPGTTGFISRLPRISRFGVYGVTDPSQVHWNEDCLWENAPGPDDGVLLGTFEIPRSRQRGSFGIQNDDLLRFVSAHIGKTITLVLVRETSQIEGTGPGPAHLFANDAHLESVGPSLEITLSEQQRQ